MGISWLRAVLLLLLSLTLGLVSCRRSAADDSARAVYFLDGYATDSAAAATALATGQKTDKGNISWASADPAEGALETLPERLRRTRDFAIGVVSTVPFNHATPASFVSHNVARTYKQEIAHEMLFTSVPDVVIGGGYDTAYLPLDGGDYQALLAGNSDYTNVVVRRSGVDGGIALQEAAEAVDLSQGEKLFGLFGGRKGNFDYYQVVDAPGHPQVTPVTEENPTLAEATRAALTVLAQDEDGFFVAIEQGDIDWSNHSNNFATMIGGIWDLDQAVWAAEQFIEQSPAMDWSDTLLLLTADHANSYMRLPVPLGLGDLPRQEGKSYPDGEVTYRSDTHTNELVSVQARGQGAGLFDEVMGEWYPQSRIVDNTQIYDVMRRAVEEAGVRHVILFIGDGMHLAHEVAGSRYLYGEDLALSWHYWGERVDGWAGYSSTWDIDTYNGYAADLDTAPYDPESFNPEVGYAPLAGGYAPYPLPDESEGEPVTVYLPLLLR